MAKRDTEKVYKRSLDAQEWAMDKMPSKKTKKAKAKSRQHAKKKSKETDAWYQVDDSWYCDQCHIEVYDHRCKHCGKSSEETT